MFFGSVNIQTDFCDVYVQISAVGKSWHKVTHQGAYIR